MKEDPVEDPFRKALQRLVEQLEWVHQQPQYRSVWEMYMIHGGDYRNGPSYEAELRAARKALSTIKSS